MCHNELSTFLEWISKVILFMGTTTKLYGLNFYLFDLIVKTNFFFLALILKMENFILRLFWACEPIKWFFFFFLENQTVHLIVVFHLSQFPSPFTNFNNNK